MKKWLLPVALGTVTLSACSVAFVLSLTSTMQIRTEYRTADGTFVGCDRVTNLNNTESSTTLVALKFNTNADLDALELGLYSETRQKVDDKFRTSVPASALSSDATSYSFVFRADSQTNPLPASVDKQAIVVVPKGDDKVKIVTVSNKVGDFRGWVRATADNVTATFTSGAKVPVYQNCTVTQITNDNIAF